MHTNYLHYCLLLLVVVFSHCAKAQIDTEIQLKDRSFTGLRTGINLQNNFIEFGIGHIFIDKPCNRDAKDFRPTCGFPKRLELDLTFDVGFAGNPFYAQKLTLLYTPLAIHGAKAFNFKPIYYTFGHIIAGISLMNITDFSSNLVLPLPEIGWMAPERIGLGRKNKKHKYELDFRISYARYFENERLDRYQIGVHQINFLFLFLFNPNTH